MIKLVTINRKVEEIRIFKDILSDFIDKNKNLDNIILSYGLILLTISPSEKSK